MAVYNNQSCHCKSLKDIDKIMITAKNNNKCSESYSWKPSSSSGVRVPSLVFFVAKNDWQETDFLMGSRFGDLLLDNFSCFPSIENVGLSSGFSL